MPSIAQFFQTWGAMIQTIALVITLCIIAWYTLETRRLRKTTVKQTELSLRPFVIITLSDVGTHLYYKNIGHSPALGVEAEPFDTGAYMLEFEEWGVVEIDEKKDLNPKGKGKDPRGDVLIQSVPSPGFTPSALKKRDSNLKIILNIRYKNVEKKSYLTKAKISRKGIEILGTEEEKKKCFLAR